MVNHLKLTTHVHFNCLCDFFSIMSRFPGNVVENVISIHFGLIRCHQMANGCNSKGEERHGVTMDDEDDPQVLTLRREYRVVCQDGYNN